MDTLRATSLSSMLSISNGGSTGVEGDGASTKHVSGKGMKMDKDNVSKLVKTFGELSKHEKILFLINIRDFTRESGSSVFCNGSVTPVSVKQEPGTITPSTTPTPGATPSVATGTTTPTSTPQGQRLQKTANWLVRTFIGDSQVALPKEEVYSLYKSEFTRLGEKAISTADFGKLMRQVFPDVKARRLGQRGQSKYCYANIRKRSEIEKPALPQPLPQNELITWARSKFNIDFSETSQVVSYLKCEGSVTAGRKRRASCGGNLLQKQRSKNATRSASVSVLELEPKDDPLMILHDNESLEIGSYFQDTSTHTQWPQLRSLLTDDSNSSFSGAFPSASSGILGNSSSKKKRHSSSVQFEFIKPEGLQGGGGMLHRSQSVPVPVAVGHLDDELQSTSTSSIFDELTSGSAVNNPLFSSAVTGSAFKAHQPVSSSSCSSSSSAMFESIAGGGGGVNGEGLGGSIIGVELNASGSDIGGGILNGSSHVGSDVFFDSVFDLMMSDCQN